MMKLLILILTAFILSLTGCGQINPEPVKPCPTTKCFYPTLPTFKIPQSKPFKVVKYDDTKSIINNTILLELVKNNTKLRKTCSKYAIINKRVNKEYQKSKK